MKNVGLRLCILSYYQQNAMLPTIQKLNKVWFLNGYHLKSDLQKVRFLNYYGFEWLDPYCLVLVDFYNVFPLLPGLVAVAVVARISAVRVSSRARQELPKSSSGPSFLGKI